MQASYHGPDYWKIEGKPAEEVPECPSGYVYCPHCEKVVKLRGVVNAKSGSYWFGTCRLCDSRITYRVNDEAYAFIGPDGYLNSLGFEAGNPRVFVGEQIRYAYLPFVGAE